MLHKISCLGLAQTTNFMQHLTTIQIFPYALCTYACGCIVTEELFDLSLLIVSRLLPSIRHHCPSITGPKKSNFSSTIWTISCLWDLDDSIVEVHGKAGT